MDFPACQDFYQACTLTFSLGLDHERARGGIFDEVPVSHKRGAHVFHLARRDVFAKDNAKANDVLEWGQYGDAIFDKSKATYWLSYAPVRPRPQ